MMVGSDPGRRAQRKSIASSLSVPESVAAASAAGSTRLRGRAIALDRAAESGHHMSSSSFRHPRRYCGARFRTRSDTLTKRPPQPWCPPGHAPPPRAARRRWRTPSARPARACATNARVHDRCRGGGLTFSIGDLDLASSQPRLQCVENVPSPGTAAHDIIRLARLPSFVPVVGCGLEPRPVMRAPLRRMRSAR